MEDLKQRVEEALRQYGLIRALTPREKDLVGVVKALQEREAKLSADVQTLWMLLDDIDTLDDAAKDDDSGFRKACCGIQQKRWAIKDPFSMEPILGTVNEF